MHSCLEDGAKQLGISLSASQIEKLCLYLKLIQKWNSAYNLVGTSNERDLVEKHLLDSLAIVPFVKKSPVLDVGSGAGLPGIPLAISLPDISFTLLDANGKKTRFIRQAIIELKLANVEMVQTRIENYLPEPMPNTVISRAFAPLGEALEQTCKVCASNGRVQIMLGIEPDEFSVPDRLDNVLVHSLTVPGLASKRHLLIAEKN